MTSSSDSIDISLSGIYKSWYAFRAGKRSSRSIIVFEYNLENNLDQLAKDLQSKRYRHAGYQRVTVNDSKKRLIAVASVRDRVVHRLLYDYFVPRMDHQFDYDVWSCRKGKGLQGAITRSSELQRRHPNSWVWRGDVAKFFDSVNHEVLAEIVNRFIPDQTVRDILKQIIASYHTAPGTGIAIGNLTSQILSNAYLNEFDRFVRHQLKPLGYLRYGDDFIILLPSQTAAQQSQIAGTTFLEEALKLKIHETNNIILPARRGLYFLGVVLFAEGGSIQGRTWRRLQLRLNSTNQSSYHGLVQTLGSKRQKKEFRWLAVQQFR